MTAKYKDIEERYEMRKRFISFFMVLCMTASLLPVFSLPVSAATTADKYGYGHGNNVLKNPEPTSNSYWSPSGIKYGKFLNKGESDRYIFGSKSGSYYGSIRQEVKLTPEDIVRAKNGELSVYAEGKFYGQGSMSLKAYLRVGFGREGAGYIGDECEDSFDGFHWGAGKTHTLKIEKTKIPAGTARVIYRGYEEASQEWYFGMYDFKMYFYDEVNPKVAKEPYLHSVNDNVNFPAYVMPGDRVTYAVEFSEAVKLSTKPTLNLSIGGVDCSVYNPAYKYSDDRQTIYFTVRLDNKAINGDLKLNGISDFSVKDDAGNETDCARSKLSGITIPYKSVFNVTNNMTNLDFSGASTALHGSDYPAKITAKTGYKLPDNISVKVNGNTVSGYTYNAGDIKVNASEIVGGIDITAAGIPQTYTVTFDKQGGNGGTDSIQATYTQAMPNIKPPSRGGYTFGGYFDGKNGTGARYYDVNGNADGIYNKTADAVLYAKWTPREYSVTLDAVGGTNGGTVIAEYDADMPVIALPVKKGCTFLGYFTQQNGGGDKYYNADGTSARKYDKTDGLMLYAGWSANKYTVTFDTQGGTGGTLSAEAVYDAKMPSVAPPERKGYTFGGYFGSASGGTQYYYANGECARNYDLDSACTLYARWTANNYDVVLNAQGGSGGSTVTATFDSAMPAVSAPDKPGYLFGGYFDKENGGGTRYYNADCSSAIIYDRAEGVTLYALWTPITYNIQLYSLGENVGTLKDVVYGKLCLPSAETLGILYPNYKFVGWNIYDEQNWAMYTADRTYSAGLVTEQGKTAYIYAAWLEKDKYTVTYDANGGEGSPSAVEVHDGETINLSDSVPIRQNCTFVGWSEKSDSVTAQYQPGDRFTMGNSLVTLFAVWSKNPELVYNANGGVFSTYAGSSYPAPGSLVKLTDAVPGKDGYVFRGWAESETATVADIVSSPYKMPGTGTVLYAVYEPVKYTVSVSSASGYSVSGINADGYVLGEYAEFTVSGASPKVYVNGILIQAVNGVYKVEIKDNTSVVIADTSAINVIYNANGGMNAPIDVRTYANGDTAVVMSDIPSRKGYVFEGWGTSAESDYAQYKGGDGISVIAEDIVLYAVWEPLGYTIKYDANGGNGAMAPTSAVYGKEYTLSKNTFTKTGCQFAGWSYSADGEIAYTDGATVKNLTDAQNGEVTLYAVWKGAKTRIKFNFEGGSSGTASCEAVYGKILPSDRLIPPTRYGYTFAGYYTLPDKGGNLVYNADMSPGGDYAVNPWDSDADEFELYASWEPIKYTVAFVSGTKTLGTVSAVYGDVLKLPKWDTLGVSVPEGYSFCGWSVAAGSDTVYYRDGQEITSGLAGENGAEVVLYAVILKNESYTVTLPASGEGYKVYYNGAEVVSSKDISVNKGEDISFKICVDDGYSADKMTVSANGIMLGAVQINGNSYTYTVSRISADTNINIYHVKKEKFRIILNDGTGYTISPKNTVAESGDDFSFTVTPADGYKTSVPVVYVNGSTLSGTENSGVFTYTVREVTSQPVISVSVTATPQHTVTFVSNGSIYSISTVEENMKVSQPVAPERNGYTFGGWYKDISCTNPYDFQSEVTGDIRLYAKWTAGTYAVEYSKNTSDDVSVPPGQTKKYDNVLILSSQVPERIGYTFKEWNTRADGTGTSYSAGSELSVNADITLYAQWAINKFAVTFVTGEGVSGTISANEAVYNGTVNVSAVSADGYNSPVITAVPQENAELVSEGVYRIKGPVSFVASAQARKIYTANFYFESGLYYTQSAVEGSSATVALPTPPVKAGHSFAGWYTEKTGGVKVDETTVLDKDLTVYARFDVNTLNITPAESGEGYAVSSNDGTTVNYGGDYSFTVTAADHYNADNMKVYANGILLSGSKNGKVYYYTVKNITANQTITVTGVELDKHTVTYMVNGQVYLTVQAEYNAYLSEPASPSKVGETFKGWSDRQKIWDFSTDRVTSDTVLYPVWESGMLSITPAESGEGYTVSSDDGTTVSYGGDYSFTVTAADHYNADNMKVYANGILLIPEANGNVYKFTVKNITDNITITVFDVTADIYTVKYVVDGEVYYSEKVIYNGRAQKPKSPSKRGYVFKGWFDGSDEWNFEDGIENDLELEAKFETLVYAVSVPDNRSEFTVNVTSDSRVEHGGSFSFNITVSDGFSASDMMVYANGVLLEKTSEYGNTVYFDIANVTEATVITVRGIGQNTYSVTYNSNTTEYVGNMPENEIKTYDTDIAVSDLIPERYGYTFKGWAVEKDGAVQYTGGDVYSDNADIKFYAVWEAKKFAVLFETNGGVINSGEIAEYTYGTGAKLPTDVSKDGYDFAGWYEDELMQGARVYEIKDSDFGDKKYYAAYTVANIDLSDYRGEYDGYSHSIGYTLPDNMTAERYQWYFVPNGSSDAIPVPSEPYNAYSVKNVSESGEYYCRIEVMFNGYVTRLFTERATVEITKKPVSVKASDKSKVYDAKPLLTNETLLTDGGLADGHKITAFMTADSAITNAGTKENKIERITVSDGENADVTENYEITLQSGTLNVTPLGLTVKPKNTRVSVGSVLSENVLYEIDGTLKNENLSLANAKITAKNADGKDVSFGDITKNTGTYTVVIDYSGFDGIGSENYQGNGSVTSEVVVYRKSSGGGSGGGGSAKPSEYTVDFETNGAGKVESQTVKSGDTAEKPETPEMEGYAFDGWYSDSGLTKEFDFAMKITKNITLYAKWTEIKQTEIKQNEEENSENRSAADPKKTGVAKLLETENHIAYLKGNGDGTFSPESNMTRAEAMQMFYNLLLNKNVSGESAFDDVGTDAWYYDAVTALANMGIIKGTGGNRFDPDGEITRAEFIAAAMRFTDIDVKGTVTFTDVAQDHWAVKEISGAASLGWISGNDDGTFSPDDLIKRSSAAKIVNNMLGREADIEYINAHRDGITLFDDVPSWEWYCGDVAEASNTHGFEKINGAENWK